MAVWAGWLLPFNSPVALVANHDQDVEEIIRQFGRIGFDNMLGVVRGVDSWVAAEGRLVSYRTRTPAELAAAVGEPGMQVLDVRSPGEWEECHIEGSVYCYLPDLGDGLPDELDGSNEVWVACGSGYRATAAAGLLEANGITPVVVTPGGVSETIEAMAALSR